MRTGRVKVSLESAGGAPFSDRGAVLFDLDGTLVDSSDDLTETLRRLFAEDCLRRPERLEVVRWVGDGAAVLLRRAYASRSAAVPDDAMARFRTHHDACLLDTTRPYPGIPELLERLAGQERSLAVVTNKPTDFAEKVLAGVSLARWFDAVVGPERAPARKPSPEHVAAALRLLGAEPGQAVVVGDGTTDVRAGRDAGAATVAVLWGFRSRQELAAEGPDAFAASAEELGRLLGV